MKGRTPESSLLRPPSSAELFRLPLGAVPLVDVERAKVLYLSQFAHVGCGGSPVAYRYDGLLGCSACAEAWAATGPLGECVARSRAFVSIVIDA